jgi:hypothetical protein
MLYERRPRSTVFAIIFSSFLYTMVVPHQVKAGSQRDALVPLAQEIIKLVSGEKQTAIQIGDFTGAGHANIGPGLCYELKLALNHLQPGIVHDKAPLILTGKYDQVSDPRSPAMVMLKIDALVRDDRDKAVADFNLSIEVRDNGLIAAGSGDTVYLPPKANHEKRNEILQTAHAKPGYHAENTIVRTRPDSPFGVEVLVARKQNAPRDAAGWRRIAARPPVNQNGEAYVPIERDEVYALRFHNSMKREAAVTATIDGVDVFAFSEVVDAKGYPRYRHVIVPPGGAFLLGWHKTNKHSDSFLVTEYGLGASSSIGLPAKGNVGVITLRFALAWQGDKVPDEEAGSRDGGNETGFGPPVGANQKETPRKIGVDRDIISIRYNRHAVVERNP